MVLDTTSVQIEVRDFVSVKVNGSVELARNYVFTNPASQPVEFGWVGEDVLPSRHCNATVAPPGRCIGVTQGNNPTLEWDLPKSTIPSEQSISVELKLDAAGLVEFNPLRLKLGFQSINICAYSLAIGFPFPDVVGPADCQVNRTSESGEPLLIVDQQGNLRTTHPVRVSSNIIGPFELSIEKPGPETDVIPLLHYYANQSSEHDQLLADHVVVLIPHLLRDSLSYIHALRSAGMRPDQTHVIGIPYSARSDVASILWQQGFQNIYLPPDYPFDDIVARTLEEALEMCRSRDMRLLIVEDGGYAGPLLHSQFSTDLALCSGIVEQTRNGIWQYEHMGVMPPRVPVLDVAQCDLKIDKESPLIGEAVVSNIKNLIERLGRGINRYRALIVGFGATGQAISRAFKDAGIDTVVFDQDEQRRKDAVDQGFVTGDELAGLVRDRTLIVGCTGKEPFQLGELSAIGHQTVFVNASSKRREINYAELNRLTKTETQIADVGHERELVNGKKLVLLGNGFPVNFVGDSVPDHEIGFILTLLQQGALHIVREHGNLAPGFVEVPKELQQEIEQRHNQLIEL